MTIALLLIAALFGLASTATAQPIPCNRFCVQDVKANPQFDSLADITLYFDGTHQDFINYPYFETITNAAGDTLAVGTLNFFGQFGGTTQVYSVSLRTQTFPDFANTTLHFVYNDEKCDLAYPCLTSDVEIDNSHSTFNSTKRKVKVFDVSGSQVMELMQHGTDSSLELTNLPAGPYFIVIEHIEIENIGIEQIDIEHIGIPKFSYSHILKL